MVTADNIYLILFVFILALLSKTLTRYIILGLVIGGCIGRIPSSSCLPGELKDTKIYISEIIKVRDSETQLRGRYDGCAQDVLVEVDGIFLYTGVDILVSGVVEQFYNSEGYYEYLQNRGFCSIVSIYTYEVLEGEGVLHAIPNRLRQMVIDLSRSLRAIDDKYLLRSLLLGSKYAPLDDTTKERINDLGIAHLLSVSGFHVGIIVEIAYLANFGLSRRWQQLLTLCLVGTFLVCIGISSVSTLRAFLGVLLVTFAGRTGRRRIQYWDLVIVAALILTMYPLSWKLLGFQLSFGAVLGIRLFARKISSRLNLLSGKVRELVSLAVGANVFVAPILILSGLSHSGIGAIAASIVLTLPISFLQFYGYVVVVAKLVLGENATFLRDVFLISISWLSVLLENAQRILMAYEGNGLLTILALFIVFGVLRVRLNLFKCIR